MTQRSLHVIIKVYYGSYARLSEGSTRYHSNAKVSRGSTRYHGPSCTVWAEASNYANSHSSEQGTLPTTSLISKQAIPYWTHGGTYCPGVSTPMTWSLADLSMTNHITWQIPAVSTIPNLAQTTASNLTTVTSHHDRWNTKTLSTQHKSNSISSRWKD
jgi:hypothetical protein